MNNKLTTDQLREYFKGNVGPVFCIPSKELLFRYSKMEGMVGIINPDIADNTGFMKIDWTLDKEYDSVKIAYPGLPMIYRRDEVVIIKPGSDIPQIADDRYLSFNWVPHKLGHVVCISEHLFKAYEDSHPTMSIQYRSLTNQIGVVIEKCESTSTNYVMVTFTNDKDSRVVNIPTDILMRLPGSFRPRGTNQVATIHKYSSKPSKPKFATGEVVKIGASVVDEDFMGLLGIVQKSHEVKPTGYKTQSDWEYTVDFDLLPNRCLSLCEGEQGHTKIITTERLPERDLDEWDEKVTDKPYFTLFRTRNQRDEVWIPHKKQLGVVQTKSNPKKSIGEGAAIAVMIDGIKHHMSCRDVDYKWDPDALQAVLSESFVCVGVEQDDRNPNITAQTGVYLYVFDYAKDVGKYMQYRVLLGELVKRQSQQKKFARSLITGKITHPWHVRRYLKPKSMGYFFELFKASEYIEKVGDFTYVS